MKKTQNYSRLISQFVDGNLPFNKYEIFFNGLNNNPTLRESLYKETRIKNILKSVDDCLKPSIELDSSILEKIEKLSK